MLLMIAAFALGATVGWRRATARGGDRLDKVQYGVAHVIAFSLATLALAILAARLGWI
jgi:hypothetical protein